MPVSANVPIATAVDLLNGPAVEAVARQHGAVAFHEDDTFAWLTATDRVTPTVVRNGVPYDPPDTAKSYVFQDVSVPVNVKKAFMGPATFMKDPSASSSATVYTAALEGVPASASFFKAVEHLFNPRTYIDAVEDNQNHMIRRAIKMGSKVTALSMIEKIHGNGKLHFPLWHGETDAGESEYLGMKMRKKVFTKSAKRMSAPTDVDESPDVIKFLAHEREKAAGNPDGAYLVNVDMPTVYDSSGAPILNLNEYRGGLGVATFRFMGDWHNTSLKNISQTGHLRSLNMLTVNVAGGDAGSGPQPDFLGMSGAAPAAKRARVSSESEGEDSTTEETGDVADFLNMPQA